MKLVKILTLVAAMVIVCGPSKPADAGEGFSFGYYGPGYDFFPGHYPRHIYYPHIYKPYHYYWYGPHHESYHRSPYGRHHETRLSSENGGRCTRWRQACTANWGSGNANYRGCMHYHRCS